jgi:hypothetical protein
VPHTSFNEAWACCSLNQSECCCCRPVALVLRNREEREKTYVCYLKVGDSKNKNRVWQSVWSTWSLLICFAILHRFLITANDCRCLGCPECQDAILLLSTFSGTGSEAAEFVRLHIIPKKHSIFLWCLLHVCPREALPLAPPFCFLPNLFSDDSVLSLNSSTIVLTKKV